MSRESFHKLFVHEIKDLYSAENQIVQVLPRMVDEATDPSLKEAFANHLKETKNQIKRLTRILGKLKQSPPREKCEGMKGILAEGKKMMKNKFGDHSDTVKDAALISAARRVEHYEIAAYSTVRSYAKLLGLTEIASLLDETLDEEGNANDTLNSIAEGGFFSRGINFKATKEPKNSSSVQTNNNSTGIRTKIKRVINKAKKIITKPVKAIARSSKPKTSKSRTSKSKR